VSLASSASTLRCRECHGEGCGYCDDGNPYCDQPGCTNLATEQVDCAEDGGPTDWLVCERHGREIRAARLKDRDDDSCPPAEPDTVPSLPGPFGDEDLDARTDEAVEP
jgi:hypothetical protein